MGKIIYFTVAFLVFSIVIPAHARLGDKEAAITSDKATLKAETLQVSAEEKYKAHELKSLANTVREYVNAKGEVFAVTWSGIKRPDLKVLFGNSYAEYAEALSGQVKGKGRRHTRVATANLVVESGGHMRDLNGRAYLTALVPAGVDPEALP